MTSPTARRFALALALALIGCPGRPAADPRATPCGAYCAHLAELHCPGALPTKKGASCETVCGNVESSGYLQNTRACSMRATSCAAIAVCEDP